MMPPIQEYVFEPAPPSSGVPTDFTMSVRRTRVLPVVGFPLFVMAMEGAKVFRDK
jgi:hypothetical protein